MAIRFRRSAIILLLLGFLFSPLFGQDSGGAPDFGMSLGLGVQSFDEDGGNITYQSISLSPDLAFGKFGIGLAITINYRFTGEGNSFEIRQADWVPTGFQNFLEIYLPKITYIRWGLKGEPLYVKLGSIDDAILGNGFIVGNYSNTLRLPADRHFGLNLDIDGALFRFPFVGVETFIGNLAVMDVFGGRVYVRPLVATEIPILRNLELGATLALDRRPDLYAVPLNPVSTIYVYGLDARLPIWYVENIFSLVTFASVASTPRKVSERAWGGMIGFGGRLINFITYGAQLRVLGADFVPVYFDPTYDASRQLKYDMVRTGDFSDPTVGWLASLGTSLLDDRIVLNVSIDGPFVWPDAAAADPAKDAMKYPHLRGIFVIGEGLVPGLSFDFSYDKKGIKEWASLVSAENALIQARLNYMTGPAVISFVYKIRYVPEKVPPEDPWVVTSGLETSIKLF